MSVSVEEITRLVLEALTRQGLAAARPTAELAQLTRAQPEPAQPKPSGCSCGCGGEPKPTGAAAEPGTLRLEARLITQADLASKLYGVRRLEVLPRTVVTPAAMDWLREREVRLVRTAQQGAAPSGGRAPVPLASAGGETDLKRLAASAKQQNLPTTVLNTPADQLTLALGERLADSGSALVISDRPHAVACQLNRRGSLRAAVVDSAEEWARLVEQFDPNVAVWGPGRVPGRQALDLLRELVRRQPAASQPGCGCRPR